MRLCLPACLIVGKTIVILIILILLEMLFILFLLFQSFVIKWDF